MSSLEEQAGATMEVIVMDEKWMSPIIILLQV